MTLRSGRLINGRNRNVGQFQSVGRSVAICLCCIVAACQTPTVVKDRVVDVVKPVATQPIKPADVPAMPAPLPPRPGNLSAAADVLLSKWCEAVAYFLRADPLLKVSSGQAQSTVAKYPECE